MPRQEEPVILVIDDQESARALLEDLLAAKDYTPLTAEGKEQAQEILRKREDTGGIVVLVDIQLCGVDGIGVMNELLTEFRDIKPIVYTTVIGQEEAAEQEERAMENGAFRFFRKDKLEDLFDVMLPEIQQLIAIQRELDVYRAGGRGSILAGALSNLPVGLSVIDWHGKVWYQNEYTKTRTGQDLARGSSRPCWNVLHGFTHLKGPCSVCVTIPQRPAVSAGICSGPTIPDSRPHKILLPIRQSDGTYIVQPLTVSAARLGEDIKASIEVLSKRDESWFGLDALSRIGHICDTAVSFGLRKARLLALSEDRKRLRWLCSVPKEDGRADWERSIEQWNRYKPTIEDREITKASHSIIDDTPSSDLWLIPLVNTEKNEAVGILEVECAADLEILLKDDLEPYWRKLSEEIVESAEDRRNENQRRFWKARQTLQQKHLNVYLAPESFKNLSPSPTSEVLQAVLREIVNTIKTEAGASGVYLRSYDRDKTVLHLLCDEGLGSGAYFDIAPPERSVTDDGMNSAYVYRRRQKSVERDARSNTIFTQATQLAPDGPIKDALNKVRAFAMYPLFSGKDIWGIVVVHFDKPDALTTEREEFLDAMSKDISSVLTYADLISMEMSNVSEATVRRIAFFAHGFRNRMIATAHAFKDILLDVPEAGQQKHSDHAHLILDTFEDMGEFVRFVAEQGGREPRITNECFAVRTAIGDAWDYSWRTHALFCRSMKMEVGEEKFRLDCHGPATETQIWSDRGYFKRMMQNFFTNALEQYGQDICGSRTGPIVCRLNVADDTLLIEVEDAAGGIEPTRVKIIRRILESAGDIQQLVAEEDTEVSSKQGSFNLGLGLKINTWIAKKVLEGTIEYEEVKSGDKVVGSVFRIRIPIKKS